MLKAGGQALRSSLLALFNAILQPGATIPAAWSHTDIKVLFKSGDPRLPENCRPIATIPLLYKLFSRLLYNRLHDVLDANQSADQADFRPGRSTADHLFTLSILQGTADEWQLPLWVATIDFKKAFGSVTHESIWAALAVQG
eukprot:2105790-Pyramimonas_sp.AAC.1